MADGERERLLEEIGRARERVVELERAQAAEASRITELDPCGALARDRTEDGFHVKTWLSAEDRDRWCAEPQRQDAVMLWHLAPEPIGSVHALMLVVPMCDGTDLHRFTMEWRVELRDDGVFTSLARSEVFGGTREQLDAFIQGLDQGMRFHARTHELDAGWGKLGGYTPLT